MSAASVSHDVSLESLIAQVADDFLARQAGGEQPDVEEYVGRYPQHATVIREVLTALRLVGLSAASGSSLPSGELETGVLGDFRLIREVGRGGMGIVYEAEQVSLDRRVALKVLPFAATMDPRHLQRFHNEARAAACLHHTNIVPVFAVGSERGVHFYAMQLIEGLTLAAVIHELRREQNEPEALATRRGRAPRAVAAPAGEAEPPTVPHVHRPNGTAETPARASLTTEGSRRGREYYRKVAELGVQAAEALDYAHERGVIHRDVKPANLMLDAQGVLWVTDFGLAHLQHGEGSLTMTGDLVGTLRYMSPEQALAKRVVVDHRTDVYSLGATLYELLTLRPVFDGQDRQELLRQVAFDEPAAPRKLARDIPGELETIVLKALEKSAADRYGTAKEMADDLRHWLEDRPIKARRPRVVQWLRKLARRHRGVLAAAAVCLLVALTALACSLGWVVRDRQVRRNDAAWRAEDALKSAEAYMQRENWPEGLRAVEQAEGFLAGFHEEKSLRQRARELRRDLEMVIRLDEARLRAAIAGAKGGFDHAGAAALYAAAFGRDDPDWDDLAADSAAKRLNGRAIRDYLLAGLADWRSQTINRGEGDRLLAILQAADGDPASFRNRWNAAAQGDRKALIRLAAEPEISKQPVARLVIMARNLISAGAGSTAVSVLTDANIRHPGDFWINFELAYAFDKLKPPATGEAIRYYTAAVALRPVGAAAYLNLGNALGKQENLLDAEAACRKAIALKPDFAEAYNDLGAILMVKGKLAEAEAAFRKAIARKPDSPLPHSNLRLILKFQRLQARLPALLQGKDEPKDAKEWLEFADFCQQPFCRHFADSARFYERAFAASPKLADNLGAGHRYNAACAAALAGCGQGKDASGLDAKERARLRQQALDWLQADLGAWKELLKKDSDKSRPLIIKQMQHWQADADFAGVRGPQALAKMPEGERQAWQRLWADVAATLQKAKQITPPDK